MSLTAKENALEKIQHLFMILKERPYQFRNKRELPQSDKRHLRKTYSSHHYQ